MSLPLVAIIEDDADVLNMIADCLTNEGYRTLSYGQGGGAYEFIEQARPDAVILDIRMEHPFAGMAVLQRLRRDEATTEMPVIVCTADHRFVADWQRTLDEHRCAVVTKPFRIDALLAACGDVIPPAVRQAAAIRPVIALIDADGRGITSYTEQLEHKGYRVAVCRWGKGVYDFAVREQPDLLIVDTDQMRPGIPTRLMRRLARDPLTCQIPLLVDPPTTRDFYRRVEEIVGPPPPIESGIRRRSSRPHRLV
jgi:DNA-binding response OmpR family regulator